MNLARERCDVARVGRVKPCDLRVKVGEAGALGLDLPGAGDGAGKACLLALDGIGPAGLGGISEETAAEFAIDLEDGK